jgi:ankyrin repeat protein
MISVRFRWAFCQLDTLRRCLASSIRKALNELPNTLDDTYERALQEIPKEKRRHAYRLFQCLVAAIRPLRVDELALMLAIRFDADRSPSLMEGWRPENPEETLLSACSTLITIIEKEESKIVQFSHFSVREFLTSDRLETSEVGNICNYHITFDVAHTILAQACLAVLLQLDEKVDEERLETFPLAFYAAEHWVKHAKFEGVALRIQDDMERLFNPHNPYLAAWVRIYDVDQGHARHPLAKHPSPLNATALYYASLCGFSGVASYIICTHGEDVNALSGYHGTPLRAASYKGHIDVVRVLLDHGANVNTIDKKKTPLTSAYGGRHLEIMRLLLEHGADVDAWDDFDDPVLNGASQNGQAEVVHLLLQHNADVNSRGSLGWTPLQGASFFGQTKVVQLLLDHGADIDALSSCHYRWHPLGPLHIAIRRNFLEVVQLLLEHGADVNSQDDEDRTPYQVAESVGLTEIAQLLLEHSAEKE